MTGEAFIPYGRQNINQDDIDAVVSVLKSDFLTQGPAIELFEKSVASLCGAKYAVAVSNATAALHIACLSLDFAPGDLLWTSPNSFVASANCALYCGASVDFVDIDVNSYNISVAELHEKLSDRKSKGLQLPKVVVPVHFAGLSAEMEKIRALSLEYGFKVIEDASHAIGGKYKKEFIGSCRYSDMTVFSFHPVKIVTTGEGGMVLTNKPELYQKLIRLRSHGITRDSRFMQGASQGAGEGAKEGAVEGAWYYEQVDLGYNYRMTDIQAALGVSQLKRLGHFIEKRVELFKRYNELLKDLPLTLPQQSGDGESAHHLYVVKIQNSVKKSRREIFDFMREAAIGVNVHYIPIHTQPYYKKLGFKYGDFPVAENYYARALSLPLYFDLTEAQQNRVVEVLRNSLK